jgi:hypothetical protein
MSKEENNNNNYDIFKSIRYNIFTVVSIIIGIIILHDYYSKEKITSINDLIEINGTLNDYSFTEGSLGRSNNYNYYLKLINYNNNFQIVADNKEFFHQKEFESNVKPGAFMKIFITKTEFKKLYQVNNITLFGIYDKENYYLDCANTINKYNTNSHFFAGIGFIIIGFISFLFYIFILINKKRKNKFY